MKSAQEMRQAAEQASSTTLSAERLKVQGRIEVAAKAGLTSLTYYDQISAPLFKELLSLGYQVQSEQSQGRNETNWQVTVSW